MIQQGKTYTCDRCGKTQFISTPMDRASNWFKFQYMISVDNPYDGDISEEKDLCHKCYEELTDILDNFFENA